MLLATTLLCCGGEMLLKRLGLCESGEGRICITGVAILVIDARSNCGRDAVEDFVTLLPVWDINAETDGEDDVCRGPLIFPGGHCRGLLGVSISLRSCEERTKSCDEKKTSSGLGVAGILGTSFIAVTGSCGCGGACLSPLISRATCVFDGISKPSRSIMSSRTL